MAKRGTGKSNWIAIPKRNQFPPGKDGDKAFREALDNAHAAINAKAGHPWGHPDQVRPGAGGARRDTTTGSAASRKDRSHDH